MLGSFGKGGRDFWVFWRGYVVILYLEDINVEGGCWGFIELGFILVRVCFGVFGIIGFCLVIGDSIIL